MTTTTVLRRIARAAGLAAIACATFEVCTRVHDQLTLGIPATHLTYTTPTLYAYDALGPHGIPHAHDGKFSLNALGFRGPELVAGRTTVVCLGASETFGISESAGNEYPRRLEARLNAGGAKPAYQVVNAALPGERMSEIAATLPATLRKTRPAYAVVYPSTNSVIWTDGEWNRAHPTPHEKDPPLERSGRLRSVQHIRALFTRTLPEPVKEWQQTRLAAASAAAAHVTPADQLPEANFKAFRRDFDHLLDRLATAHVRTIVVTHATRFGPAGTYRDIEIATMHIMYPPLTDAGVIDTERRFNAEVRAAARAHGLPIVDVANLIAPGPDNFADYFHFTDRGSDRMGALIARAVRAD